MKSLFFKFEIKNSKANLTKSLRKMRERGKIEKFMREFFSIGVC